ncbi:H(+)/Cl(-) exchange transporter ClcA [Lamprocystis purpurea]|uniref:H(+)/Cl(-) exchange transporter ClcA n=1 Tax=Lamprocystis purpurea TaxID=61598 RepID=UPI00037FDE13|nr:H(+)/Cl(-) exchange transporter ClcA [Lamprocystis purpurea]
MSDQQTTAPVDWRIYPAAALVGAFAGLVGAAFHALLDQADQGRDLLRTLLESAPVPGWLVLMGLGTLVLSAALWLVRRFAPETAGSGIQEVEAILAGARTLRWQRVLPVKFVAGVLAVGSGLVLGREGPTVHMGAALGQLATERLRLDCRQGRSLIAAGAAAGLAAAFNAPLAAIVFVTEELREHFEFSFAALQSVILACCLAVVVSGWFLGQGPSLPMAPVQMAPLSALPLFLVLGVLIGALGVLFNALLLGSVRRFRALREGHAFLTTSALGMALGALVWFAPDAMGGGEGLVESLLQGHQGALFLLMLLAVRVLTTVGSYGAGLPGGIFAPLLALGTIGGAAFHHFVTWLTPGLGLSPEIFAVAAMGALFAATVRAPLTGIILVIELTGANALVLPIILTCLSATFTAEGLGGRPIYSLLLAQGDHPAPSPHRPERRVLAAGLILIALLGLERLTVSAPEDAPTTPLAGMTREDSGAPTAQSSRTTPSGAATPAPAPASVPLVQDQPRFTIQLLTVNSDAGLAAFAQRHGLFGQVRTLKGRHRNKDWYALLLGDYATQAEAEAALAALPAGLRRLKPLVRPLSAGTRLLPVQAPPEPGDGSRTSVRPEPDR